MSAIESRFQSASGDRKQQALHKSIHSRLWCVSLDVDTYTNANQYAETSMTRQD